MTQQRARCADFGPTWPEVAGFGEAPQQAVFRDCGHSHIACRLVKHRYSPNKSIVYDKQHFVFGLT